MDLISFLADLVYYTNFLDQGRKGLDTDGDEHQGRLNYETGIAYASTAFKEAQAGGDPETIILSELTFLQQELHFCGVNMKEKAVLEQRSANMTTAQNSYLEKQRKALK